MATPTPVFPRTSVALEAASTRLEGAEIELASALDQLRPSDRSDTQMVSIQLRRALQEIDAAKAALRVLQDAADGQGSGSSEPLPGGPA